MVVSVRNDFYKLHPANCVALNVVWLWGRGMHPDGVEEFYWLLCCGLVLIGFVHFVYTICDYDEIMRCAQILLRFHLPFIYITETTDIYMKYLDTFSSILPLFILGIVC